jgi:hypothetical protein
MQKITEKADISTVIDNLKKVMYFPNGNVLFANNQVTLDLRQLEISVVISSQFIFSLDDVAYNGNQAEITSFIDVAVTDAAILASTIRADNNRFQESYTNTDISLLSYGLLMNSAVSNQASHCIILLPDEKENDFVVSLGNIILFQPGSNQNYENCPGLRKYLNEKFGGFLNKIQLITS